MAILGDGRRTATVTTTTPAKLLVMFGADFRRLQDEHPAVPPKSKRHAAARRGPRLRPPPFLGLSAGHAQQERHDPRAGDACRVALVPRVPGRLGSTTRSTHLRSAVPLPGLTLEIRLVLLAQHPQCLVVHFALQSADHFPPLLLPGPYTDLMAG